MAMESGGVVIRTLILLAGDVSCAAGVLNNIQHPVCRIDYIWLPGFDCPTVVTMASQ